MKVNKDNMNVYNTDIQTDKRLEGVDIKITKEGDIRKISLLEKIKLKLFKISPYDPEGVGKLFEKKPPSNRNIEISIERGYAVKVQAKESLSEQVQKASREFDKMKNGSKPSAPSL